MWYLRLRDSKYTQNVFDGIIKVEKLIQDYEKINGVDSEFIDTISVFLLMERNPAKRNGMHNAPHAMQYPAGR